jgi:hypothetical protein
LFIDINQRIVWAERRYSWLIRFYTFSYLYRKSDPILIRHFYRENISRSKWLQMIHFDLPFLIKPINSGRLSGYMFFLAPCCLVAYEKKYVGWSLLTIALNALHLLSRREVARKFWNAWQNHVPGKRYQLASTVVLRSRESLPCRLLDRHIKRHICDHVVLCLSKNNVSRPIKMIWRRISLDIRILYRSIDYTP